MDPNSDSDSCRDCLCLVCRKTGHVVENCPLYLWKWEHPGSTLPPGIDPTRPSPPFTPFPTIAPGSTQAPCQRCSKLDALGKIASHRPFVLEDFDDDRSKRATKKTMQIPSLGPVRSLRLLSTCPLCRLIFNASYLSDKEMEIVRSGGELVAVTAWTVYRLERDLYWRGCERGKGSYAKCVYTSVTGWSGHAPNTLVDEAVDAIGLVDTRERRQDGRPTLRIKQVDPSIPDYCTIKGWLRRCDDLHHITCRPLVSEGLRQVKLINVQTRQIVIYPPAGCDYIALSYVWGGVEQPSYKLGETLPSVPATLEDAMVVTRNLGKQYLWADSLCIDQGNDAEKAVQIALMSAIYGGAWATIICVSGRSARSGLPRVGTLQDVIPQLSYEIWGKRLLSVMPTLSQQISWSLWDSRAWTYQEGLLSPRRLFFTNHQVYFECNSVQCCESLDDSDSPFHLPSDEQRRAALDDVVQDPDKSSIAGPEGVIGRGVFRDPFRPISSEVEAQTDDDDFARYLRLVHSYTTRKMSHDADSLNAFSAMLTRLEETCYKGGFVQGLPVDDFPRALLWFHPTPPRRRAGFPTWSWAGWEGAVSDTVMHGAENSYDPIMPPLRIWKAGHDDHPVLVFNFNPTPDIIKELENPPEDENYAEDGEDEEDTDSWEDVEDSDSGSDCDSDKSGEDCDSDESGEDSGSDDDDTFEEIDFRKDPIFRLAKTMVEERGPVASGITGHELLIEGITIQLSFTETPRDHYSDSETDDEYDGRCFVRLEGHSKPQRMRFYGHNAGQLANQRSNRQQEFLLVSREHQGTAQKVYNALVLVDRDGEVADRVGVASLRLDNVELLDSFKPERRMFRLRQRSKNATIS